MNAILQIIKLNDIREGVGKQSGKPYRMQDAECIILNDDGTPDSVGVLMLSKEQVGVTQPGIYLGAFSLRANASQQGQRRIEAVLVGLSPLKKSGNGFVPFEAAKVSP